ncbi:MAG: N-acetylmuramoyl-L-alanine amidase, partial [Epulopiscium sp.]|nr:N-acetylmuramoyl-L-alanine amidase [Candidatus Epulonipiscium sp.]
DMAEKRYNTLAEVPEWGKATVQKLIDKGCFADKKKLNLTEDMLRGFVVNDRAGVYR